MNHSPMSFLCLHLRVSLHPVCTCFLCLHLTVSLLIYFPLSVLHMLSFVYNFRLVSFMCASLCLHLHLQVSQWIIHQCHFFVYIFGLVFTLFVHVSFACIWQLVFTPFVHVSFACIWQLVFFLFVHVSFVCIWHLLFFLFTLLCEHPTLTHFFIYTKL